MKRTCRLVRQICYINHSLHYQSRIRWGVSVNNHVFVTFALNSVSNFGISPCTELVHFLPRITIENKNANGEEYVPEDKNNISERSVASSSSIKDTSTGSNIILTGNNRDMFS